MITFPGASVLITCPTLKAMLREASFFAATCNATNIAKIFARVTPHFRSLQFNKMLRHKLQEKYNNLKQIIMLWNNVILKASLDVLYILFIKQPNQRICQVLIICLFTLPLRKLLTPKVFCGQTNKLIITDVSNLLFPCLTSLAYFFFNTIKLHKYFWCSRVFRFTGG